MNRGALSEQACIVTKLVIQTKNGEKSNPYNWFLIDPSSNLRLKP